ncbi:protein tyrosine phosphatase [Gracilibacillus halophilus YIM-C55.5]|uniref:Protein tyrosine phosphatase n=2 Tax=Gracilibacillus TaxID=74385 RepID=N4WY46_9BACI|nr:protein tyrosine phosphatase [Gracilibacillus halophilus YIM-C55.5]
MAEAILREKTNHHVRSAGIFASDGQPASAQTLEVLEENGIHHSHQSTPVDETVLQWADVVLTMTANHRDLVKQQFSAYADKVYTLVEYVDSSCQKAWDQLQKAYSQLEEKKLDPSANQEAIQALKEEIDELEKKVSQVDIVDPFGSNVMIYQKTYQELNKYLELLVKKLDNKDRE